jgi:hypothetical protein
MGRMGLGSVGSRSRLGSGQSLLLRSELPLGAHSHLAQRASGRPPRVALLVIRRTDEPKPALRHCDTSVRCPLLGNTDADP